MIVIEKSEMFQRYMIKKAFLKKVRALTTYLMTALHIAPHERQLVGVCGQGCESDNAEAVFNWVHQQACCASCIKSLDAHVLQKRLVNHLLIAAENERNAS